jgi:hypothetical protein
MLTGRVAIVHAPDGNAAFPDGTDKLAGSTGEDSTPSALRVGTQASIKVGAQAIRVSFRSAGGATGQVATDSMLLNAYERFDWEVRSNSTYVYVQSSDATTAYTAWVWQSGC